MPERKLPHLTAEQTIKLQKMLALSKYVRRVFLVSVLIGLVLSLASAFAVGEARTVILLVAAAVFAVVLVCAGILFWNIHRVKNYCRSLGMDI